MTQEHLLPRVVTLDGDYGADTPAVAQSLVTYLSRRLVAPTGPPAPRTSPSRARPTAIAIYRDQIFRTLVKIAMDHAAKYLTEVRHETRNMARNLATAYVSQNYQPLQVLTLATERNLRLVDGIVYVDDTKQPVEPRVRDARQTVADRWALKSVLMDFANELIRSAITAFDGWVVVYGPAVVFDFSATASIYLNLSQSNASRQIGTSDARAAVARGNLYYEERRGHHRMVLVPRLLAVGTDEVTVDEVRYLVSCHVRDSATGHDLPAPRRSRRQPNVRRRVH